MAKKAKKITQEELDKIVKAQKEINEVLTQIGAIETQKHSLLHDPAGIVADIDNHTKALEDVYGAININIEDGTYTEIEKQDDEGLQVVKSEE